MNNLQGKIISINQSESLTKIDILCHDTKLVAFAIDFSCNDINKIAGKEVSILFKESEVSIAKNFIGEISLQNRFKCTIKHIQKGKLLAQITLSFFDNTIDSIISSMSANRMKLKIGDEVMALVKSTEITFVDNIDE